MTCQSQKSETMGFQPTSTSEYTWNPASLCTGTRETAEVLYGIANTPNGGHVMRAGTERPKQVTEQQLGIPKEIGSWC